MPLRTSTERIPVSRIVRRNAATLCNWPCIKVHSWAFQVRRRECCVIFEVVGVHCNIDGLHLDGRFAGLSAAAALNSTGSWVQKSQGDVGLACYVLAHCNLVILHFLDSARARLAGVRWQSGRLWLDFVILTGKVIGRHFQRHRHQELIEFLEQHARAPLSMDSAQRRSIAALDASGIDNGEEAKPFNWTASPERIIAARQRGVTSAAIAQRQNAASVCSRPFSTCFFRTAAARSTSRAKAASNMSRCSSTASSPR